jgi:TATA-binding protein-associated factor
VELRPGLFFTDSPDAVDDLIGRQHGQDVIDSLSVLEAVVPTFHRDLWPKIRELFPAIVMALRSRFAIIRQSAARCFAAICDVMTVDAMRFVIEAILPYLGDTLVNSNRQGAAEVVFSMCHLAPEDNCSPETYAYRRHPETGS